MADEADLGNEQAERFLREAIINRPVAPKLPPKGHCYYCECEFDDSHPNFVANDPLFSQKLFCDKECSEDFDREQKIKNRR